MGWLRREKNKVSQGSTATEHSLLGGGNTEHIGPFDSPHAFEARGHDCRRRAEAEGGVETALRSELDDIGWELCEASFADGAPPGC